MKSELMEPTVESGLNFKEQSNLPDMPQQKTKYRYSVLAEEKKAAYFGVDYIEEDFDRYIHVFNFAEKHRAVSDKECKKFYRKNIKEFEKKANGYLFGGFGVTAVALFLILLGCVMVFVQEGGAGSNVTTLIGGIELVAGFFHLVFAAVLFKSEKRMREKGAKKLKASHEDFLRVFENDKNLEELCFKEAHKPEAWYQKSYKRKEKDLQAINAYQETRRWLMEWSNGDLNRLSLVEWKTLCGITKKHTRYLTPVKKNEYKAIPEI